MSEMQRCTVCGELKPLSEFHKDASKRNGVSSRCKVCSCEYQRRYVRRRIAEKLQQSPSEADGKVVNGRIVGGKFDGMMPRELIDELRKLGYKGELEYVTIKKIKL